jgi:hypothetical protein
MYSTAELPKGGFREIVDKQAFDVITGDGRIQTRGLLGRS